MPGEGIGLQPKMEDLRWLRVLDANVRGDVPAYNKSRLIAMGLIGRHDDTVVVTEKGKSLLSTKGLTR